MALGGRLYMDARPANGRLLAFINGQQCGDGQSGVLSLGAPSTFAVAIKSDAQQAGCGVPGAAVTFTFNGRAINETVAWQPGWREERPTLSAGPVFALYFGTFRTHAGNPPPMLVVPYIAGLACGEAAVPQANPLNHLRWQYLVVVDPEELHPGCGRAGADVTLRLQVEGQADIDVTTVPWQTLPEVDLANVDLSGQVPITPGPIPVEP
jgi:hypothetical protein